MNIDIMNLEGGYKAMSYNGIPLVFRQVLRYGFNVSSEHKDFTLHQLCDWSCLKATTAE
jgi:hypothetical protein